MDAIDQMVHSGKGRHEFLSGIGAAVLDVQRYLKHQAEEGTPDYKQVPIVREFVLDWPGAIRGAERVSVVLTAWGPEAEEKRAADFGAMCDARERGE